MMHHHRSAAAATTLREFTVGHPCYYCLPMQAAHFQSR